MNHFQIAFILVFLASTTAAYKVERVESPLLIHGESPIWYSKTQSLYYVDYLAANCTILRLDSIENKVYSATVRGGSCSFIIMISRKRKLFAVGIGRKVVKVRWDGKSQAARRLRTAFKVEPGQKYDTNRLFRGIADPEGRFYGGTIRALSLCSNSPDVNASFYTRTKGERVERLFGNIKIAGGAVISCNKEKAYFFDGCQCKIMEYNYDRQTGDLWNGHEVFDFNLNGECPGTFNPEAATIDCAGILYVAMYKGSKIVKINPSTGKVVGEILMPTKLITNVAFGGKCMDTLYVTTASVSANVLTALPDGIPQPPYAGSLFSITNLDATGPASFKLKM